MQSFISLRWHTGRVRRQLMPTMQLQAPFWQYGRQVFKRNLFNALIVLSLTTMAIGKVILARSRGFCAGVDMAIEAVELALEKYGSPVYVKHEVVHNKHVVESLKNKGAIFIEHPYDANPDLSRVMVFSAHGSPPRSEERRVGKECRSRWSPSH